MNNLNNFRKKNLSILISKTKVLILVIKKVDIAVIGANIYYMIYKLKKFEVFAIFIENLKY